MIQHRRVHDESHLNKPVSNVFVGLAGLEFAAGVVVDQQDLDGALLQGYAVYFHGFDQGFVDRAHGDELDEQQPVVAGQANDPEVFAVLVDLVLAQQDVAHNHEQVVRVEDAYFFFVV